MILHLSKPGRSLKARLALDASSSQALRAPRQSRFGQRAPFQRVLGVFVGLPHYSRRLFACRRSGP